MSALPSFKQLRYLLALAEQLNFTRAAEQCFVSQSTLSAGLKELESVLGGQLVERDKQLVALTPLGLDVAARSRLLLAGAQDMVSAVRDATQPMTGLLRLGVIPTIAPFVLPSALRALRQRFPKLRLALREDLTAHLLQRLHQRDLDFALIALPFDTTDLTVRHLYDDPFYLVGRKGDAALKRARVPLNASWSDRLLLLEEGHCLRDHALQACARTEVASAEGLEATSLLTLLQMVEAGLGLALLPQMAVLGGLLKGTQLEAKPLAAPAPQRQIVLVTRCTSPHMREFEAVAGVLAKCASST